jgi:Ca2+-binding RTX toxin-like protein
MPVPMYRKVLLVLAVVGLSLIAPGNAFASNVSVVVENGIGLLAYYAASGEANDVQIANSAGTMTITDAGATISAGGGCVQVGDHEVTCSPVDRADFVLADLDDKATLTSGAFAIHLLGGSDEDELTLCAACRGTLSGGPGDDMLTGGGSHSSLFGETGNDTIEGGGASDQINGGAGSDTLLGHGGRDFFKPSSGGDTINGGKGRDRVTLDAPGPVKVDLAGGTITGWGTKTVTQTEEIIGSRFSDELRGDRDSNSLRGLGGADVIAGLGGDDVLDGGGGKDRLLGQGGEDRLLARDGRRDFVSGGRGHDKAHVDSSDTVRSIEGLF